MSQANVEVVKRAWDAYSSGDLDATMSFLAPDVEVFPDVSVFPEARPLHGREEYKRFLEETETAWVGSQTVTREVIAVEGGRVLNRYDWGGEGAASGIEIVSSVTAVVTIRDGLISRIEFFFDHEKALAAVGLKG